MKATLVREFGSPDVLKLEEVSTPKPAAGEVLVRIHAAGVNPYDTYIRVLISGSHRYHTLPDRMAPASSRRLGTGAKKGREVTAYIPRKPLAVRMLNTHSR